MRSILSSLPDGPVARMGWVGACLGLVITLGLAIVVVQDRSARIEAARRQSEAIALGVDRLLRYEVRNLERALRGMGLEADGYAREYPAAGVWDLTGAIRGVISRHAELQDIDLYDPGGRLLHGGPGSAARSLGFDPATDSSDGLVVGTLQQGGRTRPVIPLALRTNAGNWLVAWLRTSELQQMLAGLDLGRHGSAAILDRRGLLLARHNDQGQHLGRSVPMPVQVLPGSTTTIEFKSPLDGEERFTSLTSTSTYPFIVAAGLSKRETLAPWWNYVASAVAVLLLYWLGMFYLLGRMAATEASRRATLDELRRHAEWLAKAQDASHTGVWAMGQGEEEVRVSAQAAAVFGLERVAGMVPLAAVFGRMHEADRPCVEAEFQRAWEEARPFQAEYRIVLADGRQRWISAQSALALDPEQKPQMTGTIVDITERRSQQEQLERAESQFRHLFEFNPLPFWVFDTETLRFLAVNATAIRRYGYSREEFLGMTILQVRPDADADAVRLSVGERSEPRDSSPVWTHVTRDGKQIHVRIHSSSIRFDDRPARLVLAEDVSESVAHEIDLAWRAAHDEHTGLFKLRTLLERLDHPTVRSGPDPYTVMYVQLRDLELVSPTLGMRTSDEIVFEIARRLFAGCDGFGPVAHVPGDSFVVSVLDAGQCDELLASVSAVLSEPVESESGSHRVEAWIGVATRQHPGQRAEDVVAHAALASRQARAENASSTRYADSMGEQAAARLAMIGRLRRALVDGEFELFFQPIKCLRSGVITGAEALLRWRTGQGHVAPSSFIPLSEESGLIVPIGEWVVDKAAEAHGALVQAGLGEVAIAVNVSAVQFLSGSVAQVMRDAHLRHGLPPHVDRDLRNASICSAVIALGHGLGLSIVAEGVETAEELAWLEQAGVDYVQGFFIGRPVPLDEFIRNFGRAGR
ncbi:MAG: EAL domain-containing protein [Lysobacteraceae bacterium]|nr:MAG: EAL domain-containing protein [Xanthomonadaceae bacterium]